MDFAKIVELFDKHSASFVSITQHFNTTTSMGRLTLNVLLSFAQFEREVTGERIRDKFAAIERSTRKNCFFFCCCYFRTEKDFSLKLLFRPRWSRKIGTEKFIKNLYKMSLKFSKNNSLFKFNSANHT